jgi:uncharacterized membrane protein YsdA (DUF1294 family)/cold shock CspA family protein
MRDQGRLTNWNDARGFGFVTPEQGGLRAFVHIRAFSYCTRRPREGDVITYQLTWDPQGRPRAENVLFREQRPARERNDSKPYGLLPASLFASAFMGATATLVAVGKLHWLIPVMYLIASLLTFCVYAFDKSAAMNRRWRTSEDTLQTLSLCGGWPGALIAQRLFHHKSAKASFQGTFWFIVILHLGAVAALAMRIPRVLFDP